MMSGALSTSLAAPALVVAAELFPQLMLDHWAPPLKTPTLTRPVPAAEVAGAVCVATTDAPHRASKLYPTVAPPWARSKLISTRSPGSRTPPGIVQVPRLVLL